MISVYTLDQETEWDLIVKSFADYDVYYLSGYVKAFKINGDGEPILIYYEENGTRAINVVIKRDIADCSFFKEEIDKGGYFDFITPYGYGGFLVEGNGIDSLKEEYENFCRENAIVSEFVRFHPLLKNWRGLEALYTEYRLGDTVCMDTSNEDVIWSNMISKNRNMVRKAQKNGFAVYWGRDPEFITPFMEIYNATMKRDSAEDYYYFKRSFYESILNDLKQNAMWFYVKDGDEIAAIAIFMFCNGKMHYHLSASRPKYQSLAPSNLLIYEAAVWAANHGYKKLHLGGGVGSEQDGLYKFKKAFNRGDNTEFHIGKKIFDVEKYKYLCRLRGINDEDLMTGYFPKYREVV